MQMSCYAEWIKFYFNRYPRRRSATDATTRTIVGAFKIIFEKPKDSGPARTDCSTCRAVRNGFRSQIQPYSIIIPLSVCNAAPRELSALVKNAVSKEQYSEWNDLWLNLYQCADNLHAHVSHFSRIEFSGGGGS